MTDIEKESDQEIEQKEGFQKSFSKTKKLYVVYLKPYEIFIDGIKEIVTGDKIVGTFKADADVYFEGPCFDKDNNFVGTSLLSENGFAEEVEEYRLIPGFDS